MAINIILQILASLAGNLFATWYGPVAIVGPIFFAAQLLANLIVFWMVLGLESFSREMRTGTYVVVVAVVLLIVNGPGTQDYGDTTFSELVTEIYSLVWTSILIISMLITGFVLLVIDLHQRKLWFRYVVLLIARASAFSLNLSSGKAFILPTNQFWLAMNIGIKVVSGIIYTRAIVVQSTAVMQKVFVPMNAATIVFINAITGIIIWEDWRVVNSWIGYSCVFLLLALGCSLLLGDLGLGLLQETNPETFLAARPSMLVKSQRTKLLQNIKTLGAVAEVAEGELDDEYGSDRGHDHSDNFIEVDILQESGLKHPSSGSTPPRLQQQQQQQMSLSSPESIQKGGGATTMHDDTIERPALRKNCSEPISYNPSTRRYDNTAATATPSTTTRRRRTHRRSRTAWAQIYQSSHARTIVTVRRSSDSGLPTPHSMTHRGGNYNRHSSMHAEPSIRDGFFASPGYSRHAMSDIGGTGGDIGGQNSYSSRLELDDDEEFALPSPRTISDYYYARQQPFTSSSSSGLPPVTPNIFGGIETSPPPPPPPTRTTTTTTSSSTADKNNNNNNATPIGTTARRHVRHESLDRLDELDNEDSIRSTHNNNNIIPIVVEWSSSLSPSQIDMNEKRQIQQDQQQEDQQEREEKTKEESATFKKEETTKDDKDKNNNYDEREEEDSA